jgi:L,D-peptidoglycan transpeptidase YkuD (ErfK/YbiS/YcfS/YnhG family)
MTPLLVILQLVVVSVPSADATSGTLQRYERITAAAPWTAVGRPVPISVGAAGVSKDKREGDRRSPAGLFPLGPVFGTAKKADPRVAHIRAREGGVCVDDSKSAAYGLITGVDAFPKGATWSSAERLTMYREAVVVGYNRPPQRGAGSCIFLHAWSYPGEPTLGCTAMSAGDLALLTGWMQPDRRPTLLQGVAPTPKALLSTLPAHQ